MEAKKKISIIMAVYNQRSDYLIQSIESILNQTFRDFEFIIIDDGSTDRECVQILEKYSQEDSRIKLLKNEKNIGHVRSCNIGLKKADCKYIARMDSDDISEPERLGKEYEFMENNPEYALTGTWAHIIDENGKIIGKIKSLLNYSEIRKNIIKNDFFTNSSVLFKKSLIGEVGFYSENFGSTEDYDFLLRIARRYKIANMPELLVKYRFNLNGLTFSKNKKAELNAIKNRLNAIKNYGYPKYNYIHLIIPVLMYLFLPFYLKKYLLKLYFKMNRCPAVK